MVHLTILSLIASVIYFFVGFYVIRLHRKSDICKMFFVLTLSMTIWSLPGSFVYLAENTVEYAFWNKISAFGWCTFEAICLYFVLTMTGNKLIRHWYNKLLILLPAGISLYMVLFLFGPNIDTPPIIEKIFYNGNFTYNLLYTSLSIILIVRWGIKSKSRIQKKQAYIISISGIISFLLTLIMQTILPAMGLLNIPDIGQIYSLIMIFGVFYSISQYQFMSIPTSLITNKLFQELTGLAFLVDSQGYIIKANRENYSLLNYSEVEVIGKHITEIINNPNIDKLMETSETIHSTVRFDEIYISSKNGDTIPFRVSVIPLQKKSGIQLGLLVLGEDIRATKELFDEIEKHKSTNERLINTEEILKQNNEDINKLNHELIEMNRILLQKSNKDSLTNLHNHQYINKILEKLLEQRSQDHTDICVMMLDIDYFKKVNDNYGHQAGDQILVTISEIIEKAIREEDYLGRYGGEEFLVVMPNIGIETAAIFAEKIRSSIQSYDFGWKNLVVTVSIGVAQFAGEPANALVNKADMLLYQAKARGRNRYELELEEDLHSPDQSDEIVLCE